jgi:two-component system, OmpR family, response regulator
MFAGQAAGMSTAGATVLVVDDEASILDLLSAALRHSGFDVHAAENGAAAVALADTHPPDIVVLDVALPDMAGTMLARTLRAAHGGVPMLFLTARDAPAERIAGLTVGGDDHLTKPFSIEDIVLRLRTILRRTRPGGTESGSDARLGYADLTLDEDAHEVRRDGRTVELSPTEFTLLRYLLVNAEKVVSKAQILGRVWHYDYAGDSRIVESYISYLRKKVDTADHRLIHTIRGVGYTLREPTRRGQARTPLNE